jgi:DNA-binding transcriptional MerR regulator
MPIEKAAAAAGVSARSVRRWRAVGALEVVIRSFG